MQDKKSRRSTCQGSLSIISFSKVMLLSLLMFCELYQVISHRIAFIISRTLLGNHSSLKTIRNSNSRNSVMKSLIYFVGFNVRKNIKLMIFRLKLECVFEFF